MNAISQSFPLPFLLRPSPRSIAPSLSPAVALEERPVHYEEPIMSVPRGVL